MHATVHTVTAQTCRIKGQEEKQLYLTEIACQLPKVCNIFTPLQGSDVVLTCIVVGATHNVV